MDEQGMKEKYDLRLCIQCGKCTGGCPVAANSQLNIRGLVGEGILNEDTISRNGLWDCTTCSVCLLRCPKKVKPMDLVIGVREALVEEGALPKTIQDALEGAYTHGNPWARARSKRTDWKGDLKIKDICEGDKAGLLYFVGCAPSYDDRLGSVARAMVKCFNKADLDFGILGNKESCCGSEVRRMGEKGLFEMLAEDNTALFHKHGVKKIVTTSPHCFNAFKNEYPDLNIEVQHYTQLLCSLIDQGKLTFTGKIETTAVYHDPCFLGKQNDIFDEPRRIIANIPGIKFVEFDRSRDRSLCCEGGGGRMWFDSEQSGERSAEIRVHDAVELGAEILVTACPFCLVTLEDAVKTTGSEEKIQVKDISELLSEVF